MAGDREMDEFSLLLSTLGPNGLLALADKAACMAEDGGSVEILLELATKLRGMAAKLEAAGLENA